MRTRAAGEYVAAATAYERARRLLPDSDAVAHNYAVCLTRCGRPKEAAAILEGFVASQPGEDADVLHNLGRAYEEAGDSDTALIWYLRALNVRPDDARTLRCAGYVLRDAGRHREAISYFADAAAADPAWEEAPIELVSSHVALRDFDAGIAILSPLLTTDAKRKALFALSVVYAARYRTHGDRQDRFLAWKSLVRAAFSRPFHVRTVWPFLAVVIRSRAPHGQ